MKRTQLWILIVLLAALAGCGYNPDEPVYDTKANPDNFPPLALNMLDRIETGELNTLDGISFVFAELYTSHPDLLDNPQWGKVIQRLGSKFRHLADQRREAGLAQYARAAELYTLASFARPEDTRLERRARLYATWRQALAAGQIDLSPVTNDAILTAPKIMPIVRYFLLKDKYHREFFDTELLPQLKQRSDSQKLFADAALANMSPVDRVLAIEAGLVDAPITDKVTRFTEPTIDLAAYSLNKTDSLVAYQLHFVPRDSLPGPVEAFVIMQSPVGRPAPLETLIEQRKNNQDREAGNWQVDHVTVVSDTISPGLPDARPMVGIAIERDGEWAWLDVAERGGNTFPLEFEPSPPDSVATQ
ncbi:hypothetical protein GF377_06400 [candidate division GN15 bacterium]|nr:hypothetical protein [candidate division GN15 bacterium]